jgi:hypothetical protein
MYSKGHYARRRFFSGVNNVVWAIIRIVFVLALVAACVYGCSKYLNVAKTVPL